MADGGRSDEKIKECVHVWKGRLDAWREVILPINSVLMWERSYDPGILVGTVTTVFGALWYFDPSILTTFSLLGIIASVIDYAVPTFSANVFNPDKWNGSKEKKFEEICRGIARSWLHFQSYRSTILHLKDNKPKIYFVAVLFVLLLFAWIGSLVDNFLLTFLLVCLLVLLPGLKHHGILKHYMSSLAFNTSHSAHIKKEKKN